MADTDLLDRFKTATSGLLFMSESDYPFDIRSWPGSEELKPEQLKADAGVPADAPVQKLNVNDFFHAATKEHEGQSDVGKELVARYKQLVRTIEENLTDTAVYKFGTINMPVFIVGKAPSGDWVGLSTRVVET